MKKKPISKEMKIIKSSNDLLRSAYQIAARKGLDTNWPTFTRKLRIELEKQHVFMLAHDMFKK